MVEYLVQILTDPTALYELVRWGGYVALVAIVFTETGLLIGCFLPGDSLLITAGLVAAAFLLVALVFVYRSFYGMRIETGR